MGLEQYRRKRHFDRTPEPEGAVVNPAARGAAGSLAFVIQKHAASHLHYDFRLEIAGTLKSWAIPKGPSLDPGERRLAVEVEDHPLAYGEFEGRIPEGEYGGGTVLLWDRGEWFPEEDAEEGYAKGRLRFRLEGEKLAGRWSLVRMGRSEQGRHNWLLIKGHDEFARPDAELDITEQRQESVLSGRSMDEIAAATAAGANGGAYATGVAGAGESPHAAGTARREPGVAAKKTTPGAVAEKAGAAPRATRGASAAARAVAAREEAAAARAQQAQAVLRATRRATATSAVSGKAATRGKTIAPRGRAAAASSRTARARAALPLPDFMPPQLATLVDAPPRDGRWLTEMKFDGYRLLARLDDRDATLWTRTGQDWSERFPDIATALHVLPAENAWLDGELVALDAEGRGSFNLLQQALGRRTRRDAPAAALRYYAFDLLFLNGHDLRALPQEARKDLLRELLQGHTEGPLRFSESLGGDVADAWRHACQHGEEGVLLKRADAPYRGERGTDWLKLKCGNRQEFVIGGYTDPEGERTDFGALLLGYHAPDGGLVYAGRVGTGFDAEWLALLGARLRRLERKTLPFDTPPLAGERRGVHWVSPQLVAEVRFAGWTRQGRLRQAAFLGLREDKPAAAISLERKLAPTEVAAATGNAGEADHRRRHGSGAGNSGSSSLGNTGSDNTGSSDTKDSDTKDSDAEDSNAASAAPQAHVGGVTITHASRLVFPEAGITKRDVARYYEQVAPWLLPQLAGRPLTLLRCPQGAAECFFQKHLTEAMPDSLQAVRVQEAEKAATYMTADTPEALLELVQMGMLELHTWGARRDDLERPDRVIFDLDPAPGFAWEKFVVYARLLRDLLAELGLPAFLKTTGGKGVHVEVPLERVHGWDEVKAFSEAVARALAQQLPEHFIAKASKRERTGRIFVDYLRNARGATAVAAYSLRARAGAPVALPIAWEELDATPPGTWTLRNVVPRLQRQRHSPWDDYDSARVRLSPALLSRLGDAAL